MRVSTPVTVVDNLTLARSHQRIMAFAIDYGIAMLLLLIPYAGGALSFLYLICRDNLPFMKYQSIGKKLIGIKVMQEEKSHIGVLASLKRNIIFLPNALLLIQGSSFYYPVLFINMITLVIELYLVYTAEDHKRLGDNFAETMVVEEED
ncbi:MAG TPA: RDD family protein [Cytophagaceae bacterium]|jgi:uncharacterized RDD family membrane protein YckC